jgi:hypothetical protein
MVRLSTTPPEKTRKKFVNKDTLLNDKLVKISAVVAAKDTYLTHANNTVPGGQRRAVSEQIGMCFHYLEQIQKAELKITSEKNFVEKERLVQQVEHLCKNLSANQETLPDLEWFENLDNDCEAGTFFEVITNNVRNNVLKIQNGIYKIKNNRKKYLAWN